MGNSLSQRFLSTPAAEPVKQLAFDDPKSMEIGIFWDYENVRVPRYVDVCDAWNFIRKAVDKAASDVAPAKHPIIAERRLYFDSRSPGELNTDRVKLDMSGFTLVGYLQAFLICLRKQKRRAGQGETNCTNYWVKDAQVGGAYYKLKGFKDQDRYKSVKESARVGGFVEIGDAAPGAVKLRLTPMGEAAIRQLPDADAEGAD